ncbi:MAG: ABC transporter ATP-binding protein [Armatimonadetes bacterium]|nr:ABC transporter ATP-binding protein [Armatimonadota bacterium]
MEVIEIENLTKFYGSKAGCEQICLSVSGGQIFGFLGPNGAGKSTLVKMLVGLLRPTSGTARLLGQPLGDFTVRRRIGYLPENFRYQDWLTGREVLDLHASLGRLPGPEKRRRIEAVLAMAGLAGRERQRVRTYSKGMQQRLGLACALLTDPELLFLDEPTSALDPLGRREVREIILFLKKAGKTVFLNSHLLSEVEMICDRVAVIRKGRIVAEGPLEALLGGAGEAEVEVELAGFNPQLERAVAGIARKVQWAGEKGGAGGGEESKIKGRVVLQKQADTARLAELIVLNGGRLYALTPRQQTLEDLFVDLVQTKEEAPGC